ncbi:MAG: type II secretion system protein [Fibrobacteria bacterium]
MKRDQGGFTLIEALVAGIISVIIPAVVITLLRVNNTEITANSTQMRLTQIAGVVSEELRASAEAATWVYYYAEALPPGPCPNTPPVISGPVTGVAFCDSANFIDSYQINQIGTGNTGWLMKRTGPTGALQYFIVGQDTVRVTFNPAPFVQTPPGLGGVFGLSANGKSLWFNFRYDMNISGTPTTLPLQTESLICRN